MRLQAELNTATALKQTADSEQAALARVREIDPAYDPWRPCPPQDMLAQASTAPTPTPIEPAPEEPAIPEPELRQRLRDAKDAFDAAMRNVEQAQRVVDRARQLCDAADADLAGFCDLDERIIAASVASLKAGDLNGHLGYALESEQRQRGATIDRLDSTRKSLDYVARELGQAEAVATAAKMELGRAATALLMHYGEELGDRLEAAEAEALSRRQQLQSLSMFWPLGTHGAAPLSRRLVTLLTAPPPNAVAATHQPAEVARWRAMHEALMQDADANLGDLPA